MAAALVYAARGWPVFPVYGVGADGTCACGAPDCGDDAGKHPACRHGFNDATTDPVRVAEFFAGRDAVNVGVRTGGGLVVLDVDPRHGGDVSLAELVAKFGPIPGTLTAFTGGGGRHFYFAVSDVEIRSAANRLGRGLDIRGERGCVVAPPSLHASGRVYVFEDATAPVAEMPEALVALCRRSAVPVACAQSLPFTADATTHYGRAVLAREDAAIREMKRGARNDQLNKSAFAIGQLVAGGEIERGEAMNVLVLAGIASGLPEREAMTTLRSGMSAGERRPRRAPVVPRPRRGRAALRRCGACQ